MIEPRPTRRTRNVDPTDHLLLHRKLFTRQIDLRTVRKPVPPVKVHSFPTNVHLAAHQITTKIVVDHHRSSRALPARPIRLRPILHVFGSARIRSPRGIQCFGQPDQRDGIHQRKLPTLPCSLSTTDQLVQHDLEPHFLTASHLVQTLQPLTLLNQIAITHPAPDVLNRVPTSRSETVEPEYPPKTSPQSDHRENTPPTSHSPAPHTPIQGHVIAPGQRHKTNTPAHTEDTAHST